MPKNLSRGRVIRYLDITDRAMKKVHIIAPKKSYTRKMAKDFFNMAESYYKDAQHFFDRDDLVNAFACVNYAHGWLDAGARMGFFDVGEDDMLFTLAE